MKTRFTNHLLPAAGSLILAASPCLAQVAIVPQTPAQTQTSTAPKRMQQIRLLYVQPSLMAWWLDSKNHPEPLQLTPDGASHFARFNLTLPSGVDRIIPIDPQQTLLVFGTDAGVQQLRTFIQILDRPGDKISFSAPQKPQISVEVRLLTIGTEDLSGIWAALSSQTGRVTSAAAFLKPDEETALGGQIAQRQARFERTQRLVIAEQTNRVLDFGPAASSRDSGAWQRDFSSAMPVIPPPPTGDMPNVGAGRTTRLLPAPLGGLRLLVGAAASTGGAISLRLGEIGSSGLLGRSRNATFDLQPGDTLALALPDSTPGTRAFLLFRTADIQINSSSKIPLIEDLPLIGELFRAKKAPQPTP